MSLVARIRALITLILLASWSPVGFAFSGDESHVGHFAISAFTRRHSRAAAAEEFDLMRAGVSRCPSRYVRRTSAGRAERLASFYDRAPDGEGFRA